MSWKSGYSPDNPYEIIWQYQHSGTTGSANRPDWGYASSVIARYGNRGGYFGNYYFPAGAYPLSTNRAGIIIGGLSPIGKGKAVLGECLTGPQSRRDVAHRLGGVHGIPTDSPPTVHRKRDSVNLFLFYDVIGWIRHSGPNTLITAQAGMRAEGQTTQSATLPRQSGHLTGRRRSR